ncbi:hypothetical protein Dimus_004724 [Dionaea muscipula]
MARRGRPPKVRGPSATSWAGQDVGKDGGDAVNDRNLVEIDVVEGEAMIGDGVAGELLGSRASISEELTEEKVRQGAAGPRKASVEEVLKPSDHRQGKDSVGERWVVDNDQLGARTRLSLSDYEAASSSCSLGVESAVAHQLVLEFFRKNKMLQAVGSTVVHLIAKKENPSMVISGVFLRLSASPRAFDWEYLTNWLMKIARGKSKRASRLRALFAAGVYCLWGERNSRIFQASAESPEAVIRRVLQSS